MGEFKKGFLISFAALSLLTLSEGVKAGCRWGTTVTAPIIKNISFGNIIVQRDTPVGGVIARQISAPMKPDGNTVFGCDENWTSLVDLKLFNKISSYGNKVYDTNVPGIGIRITSAKGTAFPLSNNWGGDFPNNGGGLLC